MALCIGCAWLSSDATSAQNTDIEGVWRIAAPLSNLKPVSGAIPFTPKGRKHYQQNQRKQARGDDSFDLTMSRCSSPGLPRLMLTPGRFKIWQRPGVVTFSFEWNRLVRQIDLRGIQTEPPLVPTMIGVSKGRWEGDVLVVRSDNFSERTLIDALVPHTENMTLTERIRLLDRDTLENRITIEDAAYFSRPWEAVLTYQRQPAALFPEDVCLDRLEAGESPLPRN
jgi:hypothetical protein